MMVEKGDLQKQDAYSVDHEYHQKIVFQILPLLFQKCYFMMWQIILLPREPNTCLILDAVHYLHSCLIDAHLIKVEANKP